MAGTVTSLQNILDDAGLFRDQLDKEVSNDHLMEISRIIDDHVSLGYQLKLEDAQITAINQDNLTEDHKRAAMLKKWKQVFSFKATYLTLIEALHRCKKAQQAREVCKLLANKENDYENVDQHMQRYCSSDEYTVDVKVPYEEAKKASTRLEYLSKLDICREKQALARKRNTGIICVIGRSCRDVRKLKELIEGGLSVACINLSHVSTDEDFSDIIKNIKEARGPGTVAIALDTRGREIYAEFEEKEETKITEGDKLILSTVYMHTEQPNEKVLRVDYEHITHTVAVKDAIYFDDGHVKVRVTEIHEKFLKTVALNEGILKAKARVHLAKKKVNLPVLTEQDKSLLKLGIEQGIDMVFASFVQDTKDVEDIRDVMGEKGRHILVISKIENMVGLHAFDKILDASDGIMVARGDLNVEIPQEQVFIAQKMMVARCNKRGKPVIVSKNMLESMEENPHPTPAELSDVANAVIDGADCVTLSKETAIGKHPVEAFKVLNEVVLQAEATVFHRSVFDEMCKLNPTSTTIRQAAVIAAVAASFQLCAAAIVTTTLGGKTAFLLSKYHPHCPIIAVTRNSHTARICHLHRNVHPLPYKETLSEAEWLKDMNEKLMAGVEEGKTKGFIQNDSIVVLLCGHTNTIQITKAEEATP